jgi:hypothetical protein
MHARKHTHTHSHVHTHTHSQTHTHEHTHTQAFNDIYVILFNRKVQHIRDAEGSECQEHDHHGARGPARLGAGLHVVSPQSHAHTHTHTHTHARTSTNSNQSVALAIYFVNLIVYVFHLGL